MSEEWSREEARKRLARRAKASSAKLDAMKDRLDELRIQYTAFQARVEGRALPVSREVRRHIHRVRRLEEESE